MSNGFMERLHKGYAQFMELDGKPQSDVRVSFAAPIESAREVNGQEQPLGSAQVEGGVLVSSFGAYQPRAFALKLSPAKAAANRLQEYTKPTARERMRVGKISA